MTSGVEGMAVHSDLKRAVSRACTRVHGDLATSCVEIICVHRDLTAGTVDVMCVHRDFTAGSVEGIVCTETSPREIVRACVHRDLTTSSAEGTCVHRDFATSCVEGIFGHRDFATKGVKGMCMGGDLTTSSGFPYPCYRFYVAPDARLNYAALGSPTKVLSH